MTKNFIFAGMVDQSNIEYYIAPAIKLTEISRIKVMDGDKEIPITNVTNLNKSGNSGKITVDAVLDITKDYTVYIDGYEEPTHVVPTAIFDTKYFADNYHYAGTDLGSTINKDGTTTFKVWAPTASKVVLNLYKTGAKTELSDDDRSFDMNIGDKGVWSYTANCGHGTYYTYTVTTSVGTQEAVDPYAKAAGVNGDRGMVVDLSLTDPEGWEEDVKNFNTGIDSYTDAIIWEIHIRDFSNTIESSNYKGKYLAFTEKGLVNEHGVSVGIDYLVNLGVNFVHLLPSFDYATVEEKNPEIGFNWGYDPKNYNVPEGSYSTDPFNGEVRIKEYKQMIMALHEAGIGVIMDVVYNHTDDKNSSFNKIVPYYYYRFKADGTNSSASGCGNDTASERFMYGKFIVESVSYWQQEYNLDGFRFDLMGLHDMKTMQKVEAAIHSYDPRAIIYGEGWDMMANAYAGAIPAHQGNISGIRPTNNAIGTIAVFNDTMRTGLKGDADDPTENGYINGSPSSYYRAKVLFGVNGGEGAAADSWWAVNNDMVVNYLSVHDNSTLWDKLTFSNKNADIETRLKMNRLGAAIIMVSKGIAFFHAGEEMLRTKPNNMAPNGFDNNSYKSGDEINNLKWNTLNSSNGGTIQYNMMKYYAGLISIRRTFKIFTDKNVSFTTYEHKDNPGFNIIIEDGDGGKAVVVVNPDSCSMSFNLNDTYHAVCDGRIAGTYSLGTYSGSISVPSLSAMIFVNDKILNSAK